MMGIILNKKGHRIVKRGGDDTMSDDAMLINEIVARAPGMSEDDLAAFFIALRTEFGEDALHAIRNGHVKFEKRKA